MASESADVKPADAPITIKAVDSEGAETVFKIKRKTTFGKVFDAYFQKKGIAAAGYKFFYEGEEIGRDATPADFEMDDDAKIEIKMAQTGGARA